MSQNVVSIATLMLCTFLSTAIVAVFMTQLWLKDRSCGMIGLWAASMWMGSIGALLLAMRGEVHGLLSAGLGNFLAAIAYGLVWAGFKAFDGKKANVWLILAGGLFWAVLYAAVPLVRTDTNARIVGMSLVVFAYSVCIARTVSTGGVAEYLPTRAVAAFFFTSHAVLYLFRIPFALIYPLPQAQGLPNSLWFSGFSIELFIHTVATCVAMLALIKERAEYQYKRAAETDDLTGIKNRRRFVGDVEEALAKAPPHGVLMIIDLDHFKRVNDTFGHVAGDKVLSAFSKCVSGELIEPMTFGRFGGEEFALFAPGFDSGEGGAYAERLRHAVEKLSILHEGHRIGVTASIGVASVADLGADFDRLMAAADAALYRVKDSGRNGVAIYRHGDELRRLSGHPRLASVVAANSSAS